MFQKLIKINISNYDNVKGQEKNLFFINHKFAKKITKGTD